MLNRDILRYICCYLDHTEARLFCIALGQKNLFRDHEIYQKFCFQKGINYCIQKKCYHEFRILFHQRMQNKTLKRRKKLCRGIVRHCITNRSIYALNYVLSYYETLFTERETCKAHLENLLDTFFVNLDSYFEKHLDIKTSVFIHEYIKTSVFIHEYIILRYYRHNRYYRYYSLVVFLHNFFRKHNPKIRGELDVIKPLRFVLYLDNYPMLDIQYVKWLIEIHGFQKQRDGNILNHYAYDNNSAELENLSHYYQKNSMTLAKLIKYTDVISLLLSIYMLSRGVFGSIILHALLVFARVALFRVWSNLYHPDFKKVNMISRFNQIKLLAYIAILADFFYYYKFV